MTLSGDCIIALSVEPVTRAMVEGWISEWLEAMRCDVQQCTSKHGLIALYGLSSNEILASSDWKSSYFHLLQAYYVSRYSRTEVCISLNYVSFVGL